MIRVHQLLKRLKSGEAPIKATYTPTCFERGNVGTASGRDEWWDFPFQILELGDDLIGISDIPDWISLHLSPGTNRRTGEKSHDATCNDAVSRGFGKIYLVIIRVAICVSRWRMGFAHEIVQTSGQPRQVDLMVTV